MSHCHTKKKGLLHSVPRNHTGKRGSAQSPQALTTQKDFMQCPRRPEIFEQASMGPAPSCGICHLRDSQAGLQQAAWWPIVFQETL